MWRDNKYNLTICMWTFLPWIFKTRTSWYQAWKKWADMNTLITKEFTTDQQSTQAHLIINSTLPYSSSFFLTSPHLWFQGAVSASFAWIWAPTTFTALCLVANYVATYIKNGISSLFRHKGVGTQGPYSSCFRRRCAWTAGHGREAS